MSIEVADTIEIAHRIIKLPAFGTFMPHLQATLWAIQAAKPGTGQDAYALLTPEGDDFEKQCAWGGYGDEEPGAACLWDGLANTRALVESDVDHPAAQFCWELNQRTPDLPPLYLPSPRECHALFANGCTAFKTDRAYWTSAQYSRNIAYGQYFDYGGAGIHGKDWQGGVARPVRRSALEFLIP